MNDDLICVFAGCWAEYTWYLRENGLRDRIDCVYASRNSIMGVHFREFVKVGNYQDHPDYVYLWSYVRATMNCDPEWFKTPPLPFTVGV